MLFSVKGYLAGHSAGESPKIFFLRIQTMDYNIYNQQNSLFQRYKMLNLTETQQTGPNAANLVLLPPNLAISIADRQANQEKASKTEKKEGKSPQRIRRFNKSLWTVYENKKYTDFLQQNRNMFDSTMENRRACKINKLLSLYVKTRSPDQCRSHHQKMMKYHLSVDGIIQHVVELQNISEELGGETRKKAVRIRNCGKKSQLVEVNETSQENKTLWDVLCHNECLTFP